MRFFESRNKKEKHLKTQKTLGHSSNFELPEEMIKNLITIKRDKVVIQSRKSDGYKVSIDYDCGNMYEDIKNVFIELVEILCEDCFVFTHMFGTVRRQYKNPPIDANTNAGFGKCYINFLNAHDWQYGDYFYDINGSFITVTKGANLSALKSLFSFPYLSHTGIPQNYIYAFKELDFNIKGAGYKSISEFLLSNERDIVFTFHENFFEFDFQINTGKFSINEISKLLGEICEKLDILYESSID